jgi:hypothetical protein
MHGIKSQGHAAIPLCDRGIHKTLDYPVKPDNDKYLIQHGAMYGNKKANIVSCCFKKLQEKKR